MGGTDGDTGQCTVHLRAGQRNMAERELRCVSEGVEPEGFGVGPGSALEKREQGAGAPRAVSHAQVFGREGLNQRAISNFPTRGLLP